MAQVRINADYCKGCELCIRFCPKGALALWHEVNARGAHYVVFQPGAKCSGCLNCAVICPDAAIEVLEECACGEPKAGE